MREGGRAAVALVRRGRVDALGLALRRRAWSVDEALGLALELPRRLRVPLPAFPVEVRPGRAGEAAVFADLARAAGAQDALDRLFVRRLLDAGLGTCFVAVHPHDGPCYMQLLVLPEHNGQLARTFHGSLPPLAAGEALVECAYALPGYRGRGLMPYVLARLAEVAAEAGTQRLLAYSQVSKPLFIRFYRRLGFEPVVVRRVRTVAFHRRTAFAPADAFGA